MMKGDEMLRKSNCCICQTPMVCSDHLNLMILPYAATWRHPRLETLLGIQEDYNAIAVICDKCADQHPRTAVYALEFTPDSEIIYHDVKTLHQVPLTPNYN